MKTFLAIQAGTPESKAVFKAENMDLARILAMQSGYVVVEEV